MQEAIDKYYVYRFVNKDDVIVYVGSSTNMTKRFLNHMQLQDDIDRIEFIECESEAEMAWKEVYYINFIINQRDIFQHVPITSRKPVMPDSKGVPGDYALIYFIIH